MITVNMKKARDVQRWQFRRVRKELLEKLDVDYMQAMEKSDTAGAKRIADAKQKLRDVTKDARLEAAKTPEELKAVWPEELGERGQ